MRPLKKVFMYELAADDVGKTWVSTFRDGWRRHIDLVGVIGYVQAGDIGKRLYDVGGVIQCENDANRDARRQSN